MSENKVTLDKKIRRSVMWRSMFLQGSWNYERMQNGGWAYSLIPALKKLYPSGEEAKEALKRHLEFFNTHPYVAAPIIGVTLALEEERANGADIDDAAIQGVKVGMMGPLAGIGDPVFWFTDVLSLVQLQLHWLLVDQLSLHSSSSSCGTLSVSLSCGTLKNLVINQVLQSLKTLVEDFSKLLLKVHLSLVCSSLVY